MRASRSPKSSACATASAIEVRPMTNHERIFRSELSQPGRDRLTGGAQCGQQSANESDGERPFHARPEQSGRHGKLEDNLAEVRAQRRDGVLVEDEPSNAGT